MLDFGKKAGSRIDITDVCFYDNSDRTPVDSSVCVRGSN
jgi:hypothetical protein